MLYSLVVSFFLQGGELHGKTQIIAPMTKEACLELSSNMAKNMKGSVYSYSLDCLPMERDTIK